MLSIYKPVRCESLQTAAWTGRTRYLTTVFVSAPQLCVRSHFNAFVLLLPCWSPRYTPWCISCFTACQISIFLQFTFALSGQQSTPCLHSQRSVTAVREHTASVRPVTFQRLCSSPVALDPRVHRGVLASLRVRF